MMDLHCTDIKRKVFYHWKVLELSEVDFNNVFYVAKIVVFIYVSFGGGCMNQEGKK